MCSNYPELVLKHPTHLSMCCSMRFDVLELPDSKVLRVLMNNTYQGV